MQQSGDVVAASADNKTSQLGLRCRKQRAGAGEQAGTQQAEQQRNGSVQESTCTWQQLVQKKRQRGSADMQHQGNAQIVLQRLASVELQPLATKVLLTRHYQTNMLSTAYESIKSVQPLSVGLFWEDCGLQ